jgi:hypothetical protein
VLKALGTASGASAGPAPAVVDPDALPEEETLPNSFEEDEA